MIASVSTSSKIVVEKSTVPVKTAEAIEKVWLILTSEALLVTCRIAVRGTSSLPYLVAGQEQRLAAEVHRLFTGAEKELCGQERAVRHSVKVSFTRSMWRTC
jgi:hypothetical protein